MVVHMETAEKTKIYITEQYSTTALGVMGNVCRLGIL